jgi:hypothetical protein
MLDTDTKRSIDNACGVLVGKAPVKPGGKSAPAVLCSGSFFPARPHRG